MAPAHLRSRERGGCLSLAGCAPAYAPELASPRYPQELHRAESIDMQVFRRGTTLEIVNSTPRTYRDFDLWINQRYVRHVEIWPAGELLKLSLWDFRDVRGEVINAGGFWRTKAPTPVRLVQIQLDDESPLIGLIAIRTADED